jgi:hypothetical protein
LAKVFPAYDYGKCYFIDSWVHYTKGLAVGASSLGKGKEENLFIPSEGVP